MRRVSSQLREKAFASLSRSIAAFNSPDDQGRQTAVLLHLQHACEMLLKAALSNDGVSVFDRRTGRSLGFDRCLNLAQEHLDLSDEDAGVLRAVDSLRDDEQHWLAALSEELLFLHARGAITVLDSITKGAFDDGLADHLPERALPITTRPLDDFDVLVDRQYRQVSDLLQTGKRRRSEARAFIRGMLAMEAHGAEDARVSERDVNRVERAVKAGNSLGEVFPRLTSVTAATTSDGPTVTVRFTKKQGAPVHFVPADDPSETAAVREVDLQRKYHWTATGLAEKLALTNPRATALRRHLRIDDDPDCMHIFSFGGIKHIRYSDNAFNKMRDALIGADVNMDEVWARHGPGRSPKTQISR